MGLGRRLHVRCGGSRCASHATTAWLGAARNKVRQMATHAALQHTKAQHSNSNSVCHHLLSLDPSALVAHLRDRARAHSVRMGRAAQHQSSGMASRGRPLGRNAMASHAARLKRGFGCGASLCAACMHVGCAAQTTSGYTVPSSPVCADAIPDRAGADLDLDVVLNVIIITRIRIRIRIRQRYQYPTEPGRP